MERTEKERDIKDSATTKYDAARYLTNEDERKELYPKERTVKTYGKQAHSGKECEIRESSVNARKLKEHDVKNGKTATADKIQWHPGFCAATELMLREYKDDLIFQSEYNLSQKPLQIDFLVVEKVKGVQIKVAVGHIFREHNIMEYKSPEDGLSLDDYSKVLAYAYLYKSFGETENKIPFDAISVSMFRERMPRKLMKQLETMGRTIKKYADGIYYVEGEAFPVQIVVTKQLENQTDYAGLKVLSKKVSEEDVQNFVTLASGFTEAGDRNRADAVLQVSVSANQRLYEEMRRRTNVCEALRELMKDEIDAEVEKRVEEKVAEASEQARVKGEQDGRVQGLRQGVQTGEERVKKLFCQLDQDNRRDDIFRAMKDPEYLAKLYKEYGMA